jgi:2-dehydropantoate 2-reductase
VTADRIAVLGIGGIGGLVAARTGALCVGTARTVAAIGATGLTLEQDGATTVVRAEAVERLEQPVSLLVIGVKAHGLAAALDRVAPEALAGAVVLPLLNGLDHVEALRARYGRPSNTLLLGSRPVVVAGSIGAVEAFSPQPGVVVQRTTGDAVIATASDELDRAALDRALGPLHVPGLRVVVGDDEQAVLWEKAARLAVLAAATVASGLPIGPLVEDETERERLRAALDEACAVAAASGVDVDPAGQWAIIESLPFDLTTSAARDAAAGRPTELDAIAGSVVRAGRRLGVPVATLAGLLEDALARAGGGA